MKILLIFHFNQYIVSIKLWNYHLYPKYDICAQEQYCEVGGWAVGGVKNGRGGGDKIQVLDL